LSPSFPNLCSGRIKKHRVFEILINYTKYLSVREYSEALHGKLLSSDFKGSIKLILRRKNRESV